MSSSNLRHVPNPAFDKYGYPDDTQVIVHQSEQGEVHEILGPDADPNTNYSDAPNGSTYRYKHAAAPTFWVKAGSFGATAGAWVQIGA